MRWKPCTCDTRLDLEEQVRVHSHLYVSEACMCMWCVRIIFLHFMQLLPILISRRWCSLSYFFTAMNSWVIFTSGTDPNSLPIKFLYRSELHPSVTTDLHHSTSPNLPPALALIHHWWSSYDYLNIIQPPYLLLCKITEKTEFLALFLLVHLFGRRKNVVPYAADLSPFIFLRLSRSSFENCLRRPNVPGVRLNFLSIMKIGF